MERRETDGVCTRMEGEWRGDAAVEPKRGPPKLGKDGGERVCGVLMGAGNAGAKAGGDAVPRDETVLE